MNFDLQAGGGDDLEVFALIGRSGTGKSHRAQSVSQKYGVEYIIDDGLLIKGNKIIAGISAKKENTRIAAIKRAIFLDPSHRKEVISAIEKSEPSSILILGTSDNMVDKIAENLCIPHVKKRVYIEDIATPKEIETAMKTRKEQGKHVIPVPTFAVRKDFSGYFIDSIKSFRKKDKGTDNDDDTEKTVVRPTYSYLGKYIISNNVIKSMVSYAGEEVAGVHRVPKVNISNTGSGLKIDMDLIVDYGCRIQDVVNKLKEHVKLSIEYMTAFNILEISVYIKSLNLEK